MAMWNKIDWPVEQMRTWYEQDCLSVAQIAEKLSRSPKLVWKICKKHQFRMRPVGSCPGTKNPSWRGGRTVDKSGYILIWRPDHPDANSSGYIREHRLVAEQMLGRRLLPTEVVHHKNDQRDDNRPENLHVYESNSIHLGETLVGQRPNWTDDGKARIRRAVRQPRPHTKKIVDWPDTTTLRRLHLVEMISLEAIGKRLKCSQRMVSAEFRRLGIPVRIGRTNVLRTSTPVQP
jgi:biotin operon repressor